MNEVITKQIFVENPLKAIDSKLDRKDRQRRLRCEFCSCLFKYQIVLNQHVESKEISSTLIFYFRFTMAIFAISYIVMSSVLWSLNQKFRFVWRFKSSIWTIWNHSRMSSERNLFTTLLLMAKTNFILIIISVTLRQKFCF